MAGAPERGASSSGRLPVWHPRAREGGRTSCDAALPPVAGRCAHPPWPAYLIRKDRLYITDPLVAERPARGGAVVAYHQCVSRESATARVRHVRNEHAEPRAARSLPAEPVRTLYTFHLATVLEFHPAPGGLTMVSLDDHLKDNARSPGMAVA